MAGFTLKDSGKREDFPSGAVRDTREGKGRFDLISPYALRRLAQVYERGAKKYADRNWEKGFPYSRCIDSALRHIFQYIMGMRDEDHLAQALFNIMAVIHFEETGTGTDDMPHYGDWGFQQKIPGNMEEAIPIQREFNRLVSVGLDIEPLKNDHDHTEAMKGITGINKKDWVKSYG